VQRSLAHWCSTPHLLEARDKVDAWIRSTLDKYGKFDGAVNMAGVITKVTPVRDSTDGDWDFPFAVNTKGVFNYLRAQLNAMRGGGSIVRCDQVGHFDLQKPIDDVQAGFLQPARLANSEHPVMQPTVRPKLLSLVSPVRLPKRTRRLESTA
jgi:NAD(P)-dependent dehydrogenase (short-subunit alcohol dehydrogenase family)